MFDLRFATNIKKSIALLTDEQTPVRIMNMHQSFLYNKSISASVRDDSDVEEFLEPPVTDYVFDEYVPYFNLRLVETSPVRLKHATKKALRTQEKNK